MLRQSGKRFYKGLYVTFKVALDQKKNTVNLSSYSPLNEGHVCILTNSMLYDNDIFVGFVDTVSSIVLAIIVFVCVNKLST